jgi:MFS transporter, SP family, inositol transporter
LTTGGFLLSMASIYFVFMRLSDKVNQRTLFGISAAMQIAGMSLLALFPLTLPIAMLHIFMMQFGGGFGAQSFFQLWSAEQFPTMIRSTAQGATFAIVRIGLGFFSHRLYDAGMDSCRIPRRKWSCWPDLGSAQRRQIA